MIAIRPIPAMTTATRSGASGEIFLHQAANLLDDWHRAEWLGPFGADGVCEVPPTDEWLRGPSDTLYLIGDDLAPPCARVERRHRPMSRQA